MGKGRNNIKRDDYFMHCLINVTDEDAIDMNLEVFSSSLLSDFDDSVDVIGSVNFLRKTDPKVFLIP